MLGFFKNRFLARKQKLLKDKYPLINITLNREMPIPSVKEIINVAPVIQQINSLEPEIKLLSDAQLRGKTDMFKQHIAEQDKIYDSQIKELQDRFNAAATPKEKESIKTVIKNTRNRIFDEILPEAFAVVREAAWRVLGNRCIRFWVYADEGQKDGSVRQVHIVDYEEADAFERDLKTRGKVFDKERYMAHFDVQLVGGLVLHQGKIAEMTTGEGKTLVATLPVYLNALPGKGVHVVTVNDYLARRDKEWMGQIYEFLGLSVGVVQHDMSPRQRQQEYGCDITYGTNNEFGFDYLRDNMVVRHEDRVHRGYYFSIVDEVDSILVDESRTPLIISGPAEDSTDKYYKIDKIIPRLKKGERSEEEKDNIIETGDFIIDEKAKTTYLTEEGEIKVAQLLGVKSLHDIESMEYKHHINQALRAHNNFTRDVDYIVKDNQVVIVDEFTGRIMPGRRWSDGLHQAIEAKEGAKIERENQTLATITFQNYFRMYEKLAGMTGTAFTEAQEFHQIYSLDVVAIPTNMPLLRKQYPDVIYRTVKEKFNAIVEEITELHKNGQPVLVGTISIEKSELLSQLLKRNGIPHNVLNARPENAGREAEIVAQAGRYSAVTIATNMAGRGTDILLGGNPAFLADSYLRQENIDPREADEETKRQTLNKAEKQTAEEQRNVIEQGGLHMLGTERHEARRIDNQLRGRCGRQGDPGSSRFYLSLEDDLMRIFGSDRISSIMERLGMPEGQDIQHPLISRSIETAQRRVEAHNFDIRKQLLEYDNVMNRQREVIYEERRKVLEQDNLKAHILEMAEDVIYETVELYANPDMSNADWDLRELAGWLENKFTVRADVGQWQGLKAEEIAEQICKKVSEAYQAKEESLDEEPMRHLEKVIMLQMIDSKWKDHLHAMDGLREGIGLRAYGQRDPLVEYSHEGHAKFTEMIARVKEETLEFIFKVQPVSEKRELRSVFSAQEFLHRDVSSLGPGASRPQGISPPPAAGRSQGGPMMPDSDSDGPFPGAGPQGPASTFRRSVKKVGRNDPCTCGSGKKYKKCCGKE